MACKTTDPSNLILKIFIKTFLGIFDRLVLSTFFYSNKISKELITKFKFIYLSYMCMVLSDGGNQLEEIIFWGGVEASSLLLVRFLAADFSNWRIRGAKSMF